MLLTGSAFLGSPDGSTRSFEYAFYLSKSVSIYEEESRLKLEYSMEDHDTELKMFRTAAATNFILESDVELLVNTGKGERVWCDFKLIVFFLHYTNFNRKDISYFH